jgi:hypothetical protein
MSLGEFQNKFFKDGKIVKPVADMTYLFDNFHPMTRPILWRILLAEAYLYKCVINSASTSSNNESKSKGFKNKLPVLKTRR